MIAKWILTQIIVALFWKWIICNIGVNFIYKLMEDKLTTNAWNLIKTYNEAKRSKGLSFIMNMKRIKLECLLGKYKLSIIFFWFIFKIFNFKVIWS